MRVHAPSSVIFVCGGANAPEDQPPSSLRDGFLRAAVDGILINHTIIVAEVAKPLTPEGGYEDLFEFENDIAGAVSLILLFSESAGSLAELGAFAALEKVAPKLLAVIDDYYYGESSFVRNGPIAYLERKFGDEWVFRLERADVGIGEDNLASDCDFGKLIEILVPEIESRVDSNPSNQIFDPSVPGHVIILMSGLIREFGALKLGEIKQYIGNFTEDYSEKRIRNFLFCAEMMGWIKKVKKGNHLYYVSKEIDHAISYSMKSRKANKDKIRWRSEIRDFWRLNEAARFNAIAETLGDVE